MRSDADTVMNIAILLTHVLMNNRQNFTKINEQILKVREGNHPLAC